MITACFSWSSTHKTTHKFLFMHFKKKFITFSLWCSETDSTDSVSASLLAHCKSTLKVHNAVCIKQCFDATLVKSMKTAFNYQLWWQTADNTNVLKWVQNGSTYTSQKYDNLWTNIIFHQVMWNWSLLGWDSWNVQSTHHFSPHIFFLEYAETQEYAN